MNCAGDRRAVILMLLVAAVSSATGSVQVERRPPPLVTRAEREAFLSRASILEPREPPARARQSWRVTLDDGTRTRFAAVETATGHDASQPNYRFQVAAYELDKLLDLNLVPPSVERIVNGRLAAVTWWVDGMAMNELDRRRRKIEPPDADAWNRQMLAVRVFDELIANAYRNTRPDFYLSTVWDNLLITNEWTIWITDHKSAFGTRRSLDDPESLTRCDRALLAGLRTLNAEFVTQRLGKYLASEQLDALHVRRDLLVKHLGEQIAKHGEGAVLYDLPPRPQ
jgi:hypothetical protein